MAEGKKVFGICRGFQLMVREFILVNDAKVSGISFYQHINDHSLARGRDISRSTPSHNINANVKALYGDGNLNVDTGVFTPRPAEETPDKTL